MLIRKAAEQEDEAEYNGEEDVSTKGREANKNIIKLLVSNSSKKGGVNSALETLKELKESLRETNYFSGLVGYSNWIIRRSYISKIKEMKGRGLSNSQIGEKLKLTSAEVAVLYDSNECAEYKGFDEK